MTMKKSDFLTRIRAVQKDLDELVDLVLSLDDISETQPQVIRNNDDDWLTVAQVCRELHISGSTFYEWLNEGLLPPGLEFGPRSKRWKISDIRAWREKKLKHCDVHDVAENSERKRGRPSRIMKIGTFIHA